MSAASEFFLYANILEIQGILHRYYAREAFAESGTLSRQHLHAVRESISHIESHYMDEITLRGMARAALMSESSFSREFKKITGTGFKDYVTLVRLREVAAAMGEGKQGVAAIAYACGFQSVRHVQPRLPHPLRRYPCGLCRAAARHGALTHTILISFLQARA